MPPLVGPIEIVEVRERVEDLFTPVSGRPWRLAGEHVGPSRGHEVMFSPTRHGRCAPRPPARAGARLMVLISSVVPRTIVPARRGMPYFVSRETFAFGYGIE